MTTIEVFHVIYGGEHRYLVRGWYALLFAPYLCKTWKVRSSTTRGLWLNLEAFEQVGAHHPVRLFPRKFKTWTQSASFRPI